MRHTVFILGSPDFTGACKMSLVSCLRSYRSKYEKVFEVSFAYDRISLLTGVKDTHMILAPVFIKLK